ncbi:MAG: hypothetical protein AAF682_04725 [Planctomycetota bacterium]
MPKKRYDLGATKAEEILARAAIDYCNGRGLVGQEEAAHAHICRRLLDRSGLPKAPLRNDELAPHATRILESEPWREPSSSTDNAAAAARLLGVPNSAEYDDAALQRAEDAIERLAEKLRNALYGGPEPGAAALRAFIEELRDGR